MNTNAPHARLASSTGLCHRATQVGKICYWFPRPVAKEKNRVGVLVYVGLLI